MGMYDTIQFDTPRECPHCGEKIGSVQTKKFRKLLLDTYEVGDCVDHAEETRITGEDSYCSNCSEHIDNFVYLVVYRGILVAITDTRFEAENVLTELNKEMLVFMYHDLYDRLRGEQGERRKYQRFLGEVQKWYARNENERAEVSELERLRFLYSRYFENAATPLQAIQDFLTHQNLLRELGKLEDKKEPLEIYWLEDIEPGKEKWSVDVMNDKLNKQCGTNWTWTVISEARLEADGEKDELSLAPWNIHTEDNYSKPAVVNAVVNWLSQREYDVDVKVISPDEAKGSGYVERLEELSEKDLESARYVPLEDWELRGESEEE